MRNPTPPTAKPCTLVAAHYLLLLSSYYKSGVAAAEMGEQQPTTTTTTLTSTSVVLTSTVTIGAEALTTGAFSPPTTTRLGNSQGFIGRDATVNGRLDGSQGFIGRYPGTAQKAASQPPSSNYKEPDDIKSAMSGNYTGAELRDAVLNATNYYRTQHDAAPVGWNSSLAEFAQDYAENCEWEHSGGDYGENLASGYNSSILAIEAWAAEEADYSYSDAEFDEETGHFTQLVWNETTSVGCGAQKCDGENGVEGWLLVCEYYPPGNVKGEFKEEIGKAESEGKMGLVDGGDEADEDDGGDESAAERVAGGGVFKRLLAAACVAGLLLV